MFPTKTPGPRGNRFRRPPLPGKHRALGQSNTLQTLTKLVGNHGGATAPSPKGKAYGFHRKRRTPGADLGPLAGKPLPKGQDFSNASRIDNFNSRPAPRRRRKPMPKGPVRSIPRNLY